MSEIVQGVPNELVELMGYGLTLDEGKEIVEGLGLNFDWSLKQYREITETPGLTEVEFLLEIIERGLYQAEEDDDWETVIEIGLHTLPGLIE